MSYLDRWKEWQRPVSSKDKAESATDRCELGFEFEFVGSWRCAAESERVESGANYKQV